MTISSPDALYSLAREARRQADYFGGRSGMEVAAAWESIFGLAGEAIRTRRGIRLEVVSTEYTPIMAREQGQQPPNIVPLKDV